MAASNSDQAPFLTYLTVFKSRLAVANIVLPMTGLAYVPEQTLTRKLKQRLSETVEFEVNDPRSRFVFEYLVEKRLASGKERSVGRYAGVSLIEKSGRWEARSESAPLSKLDVYITDMWMADPDLPSTIGVPTPENSGEALELCYQLQLLSKAKNTWTAAGQLVRGLRDRSPKKSDNPFALGVEIAALMRQVLSRDALILVEILRETRDRRSFTRNEVALKLPAIVERAMDAARALKLPAPVISEGKRFVALLQKTARNREKASTAPGVLEHRTSPRLEWLVDFGAYSKPGARNAFEYSPTPDAALLMELLEKTAGDHASDEAAIGYWRRSMRWSRVWKSFPPIELRKALMAGYRLMERSVGPTPIREVCFAAAVLAPRLKETHAQLGEALLEWAASTSGITVSGGRYKRTPELVHMSIDNLGEE
jgi:hypothetical protein